METVNIMPFSSFLAGVFLVRKDISDLELASLWTHFQNEMNVEFSDELEDRGLIKLKNFYYEDSGFHLGGKYDDVIFVGNNKYTVYEYLYGFTNELVRNYFNLPKKYSPDFKWEMDISTKKSRS